MTTEREHRNDRDVDEAELHALVDGQLPAERRGRVLAYLAAHADARERIEAYRRQRVLLQDLRARLANVDAAAFRPDL